MTHNTELVTKVLAQGGRLVKSRDRINYVLHNARGTETWRILPEIAQQFAGQNQVWL